MLPNIRGGREIVAWEVEWVSRKMNLIPLLFLVLSVTACPDGWISGGASCYFMSPESMNFLTAQQVKILRNNWLFYF